MPIFYALVAHGSVVQAEYSATSGNFTQVAHELLDKISIQKESRMTYNADGYTFNYVVKKEIIYLCLADEGFGRAIPFALLDKLAKAFEDKHGRQARATGVPYALNAEFAPEIRRLMEQFSGEESSKMQEVQDGLDKVKGVMQENINMVLERGDKLENLVVQSEGLMDTSSSFRVGATKLKEQMWWNDMKVKIAIGAGLIFFFLVVSANACGGMTFPDCS